MQNVPLVSASVISKVSTTVIRPTQRVRIRPDEGGALQERSWHGVGVGRTLTTPLFGIGL